MLFFFNGLADNEHTLCAKWNTRYFSCHVIRPHYKATLQWVVEAAVQLWQQVDNIGERRALGRAVVPAPRHEVGVIGRHVGRHGRAFAGRHGLFDAERMRQVRKRQRPRANLPDHNGERVHIHRERVRLVPMDFRR